ncbi:MAG TPA: AEC family transporter [Burkholderiaceae bacterium]|nr:AEC family transporter [Burkholderiaceae bacterium]
MFSILLNIVLPVLAITAMGHAYGRREASAPDMEFINRVNINLFCPALIFSSLTMYPVNLGDAWALVLGGVLVVLLPGLLLLAYRPAGVDQPPYLLSGMFRNTGNVGIPLMMLAYGRELLGDIVLLFVLSNSLHFSLGLFLISGRSNRWLWIRSPNLWASILGLSLTSLDVQIPDFINITVEMAGQVTIPLMLFSLGVRLSQGKITQVGLALKINAMYLLTGALSLPLILWWLPLTTDWARMIILSGLLPPAVLNYLLCEQYRAQPALMANVVLVGNLFSVVTVPVVIWLTLLL